MTREPRSSETLHDLLSRYADGDLSFEELVDLEQDSEFQIELKTYLPILNQLRMTLRDSAGEADVPLRLTLSAMKVLPVPRDRPPRSRLLFAGLRDHLHSPVFGHGKRILRRVNSRRKVIR